VDMGNMAPLLSNYALVLEGKNPGARSLPALPCEVKGSRHDFPQAGLYIRSGRSYYAVLGVSNGGVLKVFDTRKRIPLWNDSGYVGQAGGSLVTTQMTTGERVCQAKEEQIYLEAPFYVMPRSQPTPFQFIILRLLNLTVMRSIFLGNLVKRFLVMLLIRGGRRIPFTLARTVRFEEDQVVVGDELRGMNRLKLNWLEYGRPFVSIHMASARYYENAAQAACSAKVRKVPIEKLSAAGSYRQQVRITVK
jgi:hypothetical protein